MQMSEEYLKGKDRKMSETYLKDKDNTGYYAISIISIIIFVGYKIAIYENIISVTEKQSSVIFWLLLIITIGSLVLGIIKKWVFKI